MAIPSDSAVRGVLSDSSIVDRIPSSSFGDTRREEEAPGVSSFFGLTSALDSDGVTGRGDGAADDPSSISQ